MSGTAATVPWHPRLTDALDAEAQNRLLEMSEEITADPTRVRVLHPAAARVVGRGPLDPADPRGVCGPTLDDAVRAVLVAAVARGTSGTEALRDEVDDLYRYGDADEKRSVLRALPQLDIGDAALPLVSDALRTNDVRLVAAALGDYGAEHLPSDAWRQGVLKCLFVEVPLSAVARLEQRTDAELARMVAAYCHERVAAGRSVPADVWLVLDAHAEALDDTPIRGELESPYPDRRAAARAFLDSRTPASTPADHSTSCRKEA